MSVFGGGGVIVCVCGGGGAVVEGKDRKLSAVGSNG